MHYKTLVRSAIACMVITTASACGGTDSTGPDYDATVTAENAEGAANQGFGMANEMMYSIYSGQIGLSPGAVRQRLLASIAHAGPVRTSAGEGKWRLSLDNDRLLAVLPGAGPRPAAPPGCSTSESGANEPGEPLDANGNDFPDDYHFRMECLFTEEGDGDTVYTSRQVLDVLLRERPQDLVGFEVKVSQSQRQSDNHENFQEYLQRTELLLSVRADRATHHELTLISLRSHLPGDTETDFIEQSARGDASYDPFSPISLEAPLPDGELTLNGDVHLISTADDIAVRFVLDTPTPLEFDRGCAEGSDQPFVNGVLRGRLNGRSNIGFAITFNSCGNDPDYETFGIEDVPAAPKFIAPRFHP